MAGRPSPTGAAARPVELVPLSPTGVHYARLRMATRFLIPECTNQVLPSSPRTVPAILERYRGLARALDSRFRVPGTRIRFGWDALIGLVPGLGDAAGGLLGAYGLWTAHQLGAPAPVLFRMLLNLGIDLGVGTLPLLGDLFDVVWKGNQRNLALLERWLERPHETRRRSGMLLAAILSTLLLLILAAGYLALWLARGLLSGFGR